MIKRGVERGGGGEGRKTHGGKREREEEKSEGKVGGGVKRREKGDRRHTGLQTGRRKEVKIQKTKYESQKEGNM